MFYDTQAFDFPRPFSPTQEDLVHGVKMWKLAQDILDTGKLKPSPTLIMPKGLASVQDGFKYMMDGKVRTSSRACWCPRSSANLHAFCR